MARNGAESLRSSGRTVVCVVSETGALPEWRLGQLGALWLTGDGPDGAQLTTWSGSGAFR
jgi:hypothetical protein